MATKPKTSSPVDRLAALTGERDRLREQADLVRAAPRALAEAVADIPKVVEALVERVNLSVGFLATPGGWGDLVHAMGSHSPNEYAPRTAEATLAWAAPELLAAAIERDLVRAYEAMPTPMAAAAKATELKRLNDQIASVEVEISIAWWSAADSGLQLPPPDISGAVLIGLPPA